MNLPPGEDIRYEVSAQEILPAPLDIAEKLKLPPGTNIIHIARRKFLGQRVVSYSERYLLEDILPSLVREDLTRVGSIHALLEAASKYPLLRAELEIEAHIMDEEESGLLNARPGQAAISITRMTYTAPNRPAVWYWGLFMHEYQIAVSIS
ncbi:MAG: UTRA domain-containing protein [Anaerolineaceae bacterium]